jgi:hypothetical protein
MRMSDDRATVELPKPVRGSRYSVKRSPADERAQSPLVEHVRTGQMRIMRPTTDAEGTDVGPPPLPPRWRVERCGDRVVLRGDGVVIEMTDDEALRIAETILRAR